MLFLSHGSLLKHSVVTSLLVASALLISGSGNLTVAQDKVVKKTAVQQADASSGKGMYISYCAACHGPEGKGNGPAASELKTPPADLTQLTKNNNGKFPADHVRSILDFGTKAPAHGSNEMPVWGTLFRALDQHDQVKVTMRIRNLVDYINTLQAK
jgi:mono/diheme cytochrome c family protein